LFFNITKYFLKTNKVGLWWFYSIFVTVWLSLHKLAHNVLQLGEGGGFLVHKFKRSTALEPTTKLSNEALHPPLRQDAVMGWFYSLINFKLVSSILIT
jgi:hypothetical protein